jgi:hypothetical protein
MMKLFISLLVLLTVFSAVPASAGPEGPMTLVHNVSTAARWFDPAESEHPSDAERRNGSDRSQRGNS